MPRPKGLETESRARVVYVWIAFLFFGIFILTKPLLARPPEPERIQFCFSPEFIRATTKAKRVAPYITEYKGKTAMRLIATLNSKPPQSSYVGDHVIMWSAPYKPPLLSVIFNKGCAVVECIYSKGCKALPRNFALKPKGERL